jgi:hypothetical protein
MIFVFLLDSVDNSKLILKIAIFIAFFPFGGLNI